MVSEQQREQRSSVIIRATIGAPDGSLNERRVRNLSSTGACIEHEGDLVSGMRLMVAMGALPTISAEVMWTRERLAGIQFERPVALEDARKPRGIGRIAAGWLDELRDPYRG